MTPRRKKKKRFSLGCTNRNKIAEEIRLHWEIISDTIILIHRSNETVLSINIWHFKSAGWYCYHSTSVPWPGTPLCRPHVQINSTKEVTFLEPSSINFIIHQSNHYLPRTVMVPTNVKIITKVNNISIVKSIMSVYYNVSITSFALISIEAVIIIRVIVLIFF